MPDARRGVPRTDTVLDDPRLRPAVQRLGRDAVRVQVRSALDRVREGRLAAPDVLGQVLAACGAHPGSMRPVLNATGVVLHTNLGRAPLSAAALAAVADAAGYVDVELDLGDGRRARRGRGALDALAAQLPERTGVLIVNNGAAALLLAVTALAAGREVVWSRGELVEIGDGFRLPELVRSGGARIREVGTTNRTRLEDYRNALGPDTGCLLKVHPSNFTVQGFTGAVGVRALAGLGLPLIVDVGSGLLRPDPALPGEPDITTALRDGATLVTASGDKLLGGPQAGLVAGDPQVVEQLRRHPMARALRVDKLTLAALEATVRGPATPTRLALRADPARLRERAEALATELGAGVTVVASAGQVGGGGGPGVTLAGWAVALPDGCAALLRRGSPAVLARLEGGRCLVDLRCVPAERDPELLGCIREAMAACK